MKSTGGFILEKVEGLAITRDGQAWISTDNDGTGQKSTGETLFLNIGKIQLKLLIKVTLYKVAFFAVLIIKKIKS